MADFPSPTSASGIWTLKKQTRASQIGNWPLPIKATGGTMTTSGGYTYHTYTTSGTFRSLSTAPLNAEYLVIAGGGGGGDRSGGGGGAGGFLSGTYSALPTTTYAVVVGGGGVAGNYEGSSAIPLGVGGRGTDSSVTTLVTAFGGGGGGTYDGNPTGTFGSGGGGASSLGTPGTPYPGNPGTAGQGNKGGDGIGNASVGGGGGGGAGLPGGTVPNNSGGNGLQFPIYSSGWSNYFDGTGDYLQIADNAAFKFGSGNFTIELWIYPTALPTASMLITKWNASLTPTSNQWVLTLSSAQPNFAFSTDGFNVAATLTSPNVRLNEWNHIAAVRNGNIFTLYTNGVAGTPVISSGTLFATETEPLGISWRRNNGSTIEWYSGYMSNIRIVKGTALYTTTFVPSTQPLTAVSGTSLLTCQNSTIRDNSTNAFTVTVAGNTVTEQFGPYHADGIVSYSGYFDGTDDYLNAGTNTAFAFGTGNFTIECWFYDNGTSVNSAVLVGSSNYGTGTNVQLYYNGVTNSLVYLGQTGLTITASTNVVENIWNHVAIVRSGTIVTLFLNGVSVGSVTDGNNITSTIAMCVGATANANGNTFFKGYISNVRIVKGTAVYTANFTPSIRPLTAITGTSLLTCQDTTFKDNSTNNFTVTANGNVTGSLNNPFLYKTYYAGGGGGGWNTITGPVTLGGVGGGGSGAWDDTTISAGLANSGGGGGGSRSNNTATIGRPGGSGIVAIRYLAGALPESPTSVVATATGTSTASVTFAAPISQLPITSYTAVSTPNNIVSTSTNNTINFTGLSSSTAYYFTVYATNSAGGIGSIATSNTTTTTQSTYSGVITYSLGASGSGGIGAAVGGPGGAGGSTSVTYSTYSIQANGGGGGGSNNNVGGTGGTISTVGAPNSGGAVGGGGAGRSGDQGGGSGGALGTVLGLTAGTAGGTGAAAADVGGLSAAVQGAGLSYATSPGTGGLATSASPNNMNGGNATGFGSGGGGAGYYGGSGGNGLYGGGGGGAAGYTAVKNGGAGGAGSVVLRLTIIGTGVQYQHLTSGSSYTLPANCSAFKVWAIGAGGGGAGVTNNDAHSAGGGGAGGVAFMEFTSQ